jgi:tyrosinase
MAHDHNCSRSQSEGGASAPPRAGIQLNDSLRAALETTLQAATTRVNATRPRTRKDVRTLSAMEVNVLRNALEGMFAISDPNDERGFEWIAGRHGYPGNYCHRNEADFWVWHRAYMYEYEERLRDAQVRAGGEATVTLPYWDWTIYDAATDDAYGIPTVLSDAQYTDLVTGETKPNPLYSAYSIATQKNTVRYPQRLRDYLAQRKAGVDKAMTQSDFLTAQQTINYGPHGNVHLYTGGQQGSATGDMYSIRTAAFDPIFFLHHANIDRIWWEWQQKFGNQTVPAAQRAFVAAPWTYTGEQCLDPENFFHYTYSQEELFASFQAGRKLAASRADGDAPSAAAHTLSFNLGTLRQRFDTARLEFLNFSKTEGSYEVRVFVNQDGASGDTPTDGNPGYAGTLFIFGHGECIGDEGHCDVPVRRAYDKRPRHHYTPFNTNLDVTDALRQVTSGGPGGQPLSVSFVVLDPSGQQVPPDEIRFEGVALETR